MTQRHFGAKHTVVMKHAQDHLSIKLHNSQ